MIQQIVEYIAQYKDLYNREAIDRQLLDAGYAQADINAAWSQLAQTTLQQGRTVPPVPSGEIVFGWGNDYAEPPQRERISRSGMFWATMVGFIVISYAALALALFFAVNASQSAFPFATIATIIFAGLELGALILGVIALNGRRPLGMGLLYGVLMTLVVLPFTAFVILLGVCLTSTIRL